MKCVVLAYHNIGCVGLEALQRHGFEIQAIFTHADDPGETCWFDSVAEWAAARDLPVYAPQDINHPLWVERIRRLGPDVLLSFYYRRLVGRDILSLPPAGCLNLHGSLLPRYRGRCPINWALINGESETGVTLHHMTERADAGDIVDQERIPIAETDTALTLHRKAAVAAAVLLDRSLPLIQSGGAARHPQDERQATTYGARRPADGRINWTQPAASVRNLVRAVTRPYPGAFTHQGDTRVLFWDVETLPPDPRDGETCPGEVLSVDDALVIACGTGAVEVRRGQVSGGVVQTGSQLARSLNWVRGTRLGAPRAPGSSAGRSERVLILGVNGFIGSHLSERLLAGGRYQVYGLDLHRHYIEHLIGRPGFHFEEGDIAIQREWIEYHVKTCDVVLPLVAIATPIEYTRNPLRVFELDFEENLRVVRYCVKYGKRLLFPSTSEVYGMCDEEAFDEDDSRLILGPIRMQRWIYSCSKQLLDRVIWAYGQQADLRFTLFRPFNWIGPRLDSLRSARIGSSRAITQLILNLVQGTPIQLIDGGQQRRCFTDVADGIEGLFRIVENREHRCDGRIINLGNPDNELSIRALAELLVACFERHPLRHRFPPFAGFQEIESGAYYGTGYQDMQRRRPRTRNAQRFLGWRPRVGVEQSVEQTLDFFLRQALSDTPVSEPSRRASPVAIEGIDAPTACPGSPVPQRER